MDVCVVGGWVGEGEGGGGGGGGVVGVLLCMRERPCAYARTDDDR